MSVRYDRAKRIIGRQVVRALIAIVVTGMLFPYVWLLITSVKPVVSTWDPSPSFVFAPSLENYRTIWEEPGLLQSFVNTIVVAVTVTVLSVLFGAMAGYGMARYRLGGRKLLFFVLFVAMMPGVIILIPEYMIFSSINLLDTRTALILINISFALPFAVWMMRGFFMDMPLDCEEAAQVDGCTAMGAFWRVALPMATPGLVAVGILTFIGVWNEYMFAVTFYSEQAQTLPVFTALVSLSRFSVEWGPMSAIGSLATAPVVMLAFLVRRHMVRGISFGVYR